MNVIKDAIVNFLKSILGLVAAEVKKLEARVQALEASAAAKVDAATTKVEDAAK